MVIEPDGGYLMKIWKRVSGIEERLTVLYAIFVLDLKLVCWETIPEHSQSEVGNMEAV